MKAMGLTPVTPARETVMLLRPGMNLTNRSAPGPIFRYIASVLRMQLSGETVIRHSCASTFRPCRRAIQYQVLSARTEAHRRGPRRIRRPQAPVQAAGGRRRSRRRRWPTEDKKAAHTAFVQKDVKEHGDDTIA